MDLPMILRNRRQLSGDDGYSHDIEDTTQIFILVVCKFVIASPLSICGLDLPIHLTMKWPFEIAGIFLMSLNDRANGGILRLLFGYFPNVQRFFVRDIKSSPNLVDHILY